MTATNHTEHYGLSQYTEDDRPTYTGDYNGDMSKIDAAIYAASQSGGTSGLTEVAHTADLTGDGTDGNPLGVADTIARTEDIPSLDGYATTESVTQAIAAAIADRLTAGDIKAGNGINIEASGNTVTISYVGGGGGSGGLMAVAHDNTLTGDGTTGSKLSVISSFKNATYAGGSSDFMFDPNAYVDAGVYFVSVEKSNSAVENIPPDLLYDGIRASLVVCKCGTGDIDVAQLWINRSAGNGEPFISFRINNGKWLPWQRLAFTSDIPDVSALTSRIADLESKVNQLIAAATPSVTGLTATQLDTQYSDGYNIVRVGTPTRSNESEESSQ